LADIDKGIEAVMPAAVIAGVVGGLVIEFSRPAGLSGITGVLMNLPSGMFIWLGVVAGLIFGVVFGALYAVFYERLPAKSDNRKAMIFWVILWAIFAAVPFGVIFAAGMQVPAGWIVGTLVASLVCGALTAVFW
jgi:hypothetical protein